MILSSPKHDAEKHHQHMMQKKNDEEKKNEWMKKNWRKKNHELTNLPADDGAIIPRGEDVQRVEGCQDARDGPLVPLGRGKHHIHTNTNFYWNPVHEII